MNLRSIEGRVMMRVAPLLFVILPCWCCNATPSTTSTSGDSAQVIYDKCGRLVQERVVTLAVSEGSEVQAISIRKTSLVDVCFDLHSATGENERDVFIADLTIDSCWQAMWSAPSCGADCLATRLVPACLELGDRLKQTSLHPLLESEVSVKYVPMVKAVSASVLKLATGEPTPYPAIDVFSRPMGLYLWYGNGGVDDGSICDDLEYTKQCLAVTMGMNLFLQAPGASVPSDHWVAILDIAAGALFRNIFSAQEVIDKVESDIYHLGVEQNRLSVTPDSQLSAQERDRLNEIDTLLSRLTQAKEVLKPQNAKQLLNEMLTSADPIMLGSW